MLPGRTMLSNSNTVNTIQTSAMDKCITFCIFALGYALSLSIIFEAFVYYFPKLNGVYPFL